MHGSREATEIEMQKTTLGDHRCSLELVSHNVYQPNLVTPPASLSLRPTELYHTQPNLPKARS